MRAMRMSQSEPQLNDATMAGNQILEQIFGSKDVSRGVANQAADLSGVGSAILKKMLPVIAAMIIGNLTKGMMGGGAPAPTAARSEQRRRPWRHDQGRARRRPVQRARRRKAEGSAIFWAMFSAAAPRAGQGGGGGLGDILSDILGGGQSGGLGPAASEAIRRGRETLDDVLGRGTHVATRRRLLNSVERATRR